MVGNSNRDSAFSSEKMTDALQTESVHGTRCTYTRTCYRNFKDKIHSSCRRDVNSEREWTWLSRRWKANR